MPAKSPIDLSDPTLRLTIKINGKVMKDDYPVVNVNVTHEINRISIAELTIIDGAIESEDFPISDSEDFLPGNTIEILAGYGEDSEHLIFKGIIVRHVVRLDPELGGHLVVTCKHPAVVMTFNRVDETFKDTTDSDVISEVLNKYSLNATIDKINNQQELIYQKSATDWDFILSRAEFHGYIILLDEGDLKIGKPVFDGAPLLRLTSGDSIISFQAELNAEKQPSSLVTNAWDPDNQQMISSDASEPVLNTQGNTGAKNLSEKLNQSKLSLTSVTPMQQEQLKAWADGKLLLMRMNAIKGQATFTGNANVKTGGLIELENVGARFNGNAFISRVSHIIEDGLWSTKVKFGFDNKPVFDHIDFSYPAASGQLPAIHGLQIGTVEKIAPDDAIDKNKVLIRLPSSATNQNGVWARISNFYATSGAGAFFLPEAGDEVIVGFLDSDPCYPVVLGSLYSNARKAAVEVKDNDNYIKSLTTKGNLKVTFDDEKKCITIETPGGNTFLLDDDNQSVRLLDQSNNVVEMNTEGIKITSQKDITLQATGNITLDATGALKLSSNQDVETTGINIKNEAKAGFTAKGNASAELSASGQTVVKGGLVMIN